MTERRRTVHYLAECSGCMTRHTGPNAQALAAVHHDRTGHVITVTRVTTYGLVVDQGAGAELEAAGQASLEVEPFDAGDAPLELCYRNPGDLADFKP